MSMMSSWNGLKYEKYNSHIGLVICKKKYNQNPRDLKKSDNETNLR